MGAMPWDHELEPGQDDLVKEDKASKKIKKAVTGSGRDATPEALYTDHKAGDPDTLTPYAEKQPVSGNRSPVRRSLGERLRDGIDGAKSVLRNSRRR